MSGYVRALPHWQVGIGLDATFRTIVGNVEPYWPQSSQLSWLVSAYAQQQLPPAEAVVRAVRLNNRLRRIEEMVASWCVLGQSLYAPEQVHPYLLQIQRWRRASAFDALQWLSGWVYERVQYVSDQQKWGVVDRWQSPALTLFDGTGDCEDMSLVLWSAAPWIGLSPGRLVIGSIGGQGHAWVEFPKEQLYAEATNGSADWLFLRPSTYEPWLYIEPTRCVRISPGLS